jgi:histidine triad (HIT) family protein
VGAAASAAVRASLEATAGIEAEAAGVPAGSQADPPSGDSAPAADPLPGAPGEDGRECVFCNVAVQPPALLEMARVRLVPDKYPLFAGHLLIITREHLACLGAAPAETLAEVERMAALARRFIGEAYGRPFTWENGVAGQSVFHAHLHVIPGPEVALPAPRAGDGSAPVAGWGEVGAWYREHGPYHYAESGEDRRVIEPDGELIWKMRASLGAAARLRFVDGRFERATTPADVAEVARRWEAWPGRRA